MKRKKEECSDNNEIYNKIQKNCEYPLKQNSKQFMHITPDKYPLINNNGFMVRRIAYYLEIKYKPFSPNEELFTIPNE